MLTADGYMPFCQAGLFGWRPYPDLQRSNNRRYCFYPTRSQYSSLGARNFPVRLKGCVMKSVCISQQFTYTRRLPFIDSPVAQVDCR